LANIISSISGNNNPQNLVSNPHNVKPIIRYASHDDPLFVPPVYDEPQAVDVASWQAKAFTDLRIWLNASSDKQKTVEAWAAMYLSCGACYRGFMAWAAGCKAETVGWLPLAVEAIKKHRWI
jgi:hypothetical protein